MGLENPLHIAIILLVVLMVFGAKRLPEMGKSMGEGMRGFKHAISGDSAPADLPETTPAPAAAAAPAPLVLTADRERVPAERVPAEPVA